MEINGRTLEFEEETHTYLVDGEKVESVTQLLKRKFPSKYADIAPEVLKRASERGTMVHKAIEAYCKGFDDWSDEVQDFKFLKKHYNFHVLKNELPIIISFAGKTYAGTCDMILEMDDVYSVADIKTTSTLDKEYLGHQLNLYRIGVMQCYGYNIQDLYGIHLRDGTRKLVKIPIVEEADLIESMKEVL